MKIGGFVPRFARAVRVNRRVAAVGVLTVVTILALNLYASANPTPAQRLLASLILACGALPTMMWASDRQWPCFFVSFLGVFHAVCFGLPIFLRSEFLGSWFGEPLIDTAMITAALLLALASWGLLLLGYFGPVSRWATRKLPRVNVLSTARVPGLKAFAITLSLVAALFLYLDTRNATAFYTGQPLLELTLTFPVIFVGQMVVLSILMLFYLQERGELGRAGKSFLWGLVTYYTLLGLSTGMVSHGLSAIVALSLGTAIVTPVLTWRIVSWGVLIAAILLFLIIPVREYYRTLVWTHGIDPGSQGTLRRERSLLSPEDIAVGRANFVRSSYDLVFGDNILIYTLKGEGARCEASIPNAISYSFFLHIYPVEEQIALDSNFGLPYVNRDFSLSTHMPRVDGKCIHHIKLPPYDIKYLITGILDRRNDFLLPAEAGESKRVSRRKTLISFVPGSWKSIDARGEWQLMTRNATEWELGPYLDQRRLLIVAANDRERNELMSLNPGDTIRVMADANNWGEYRLAHVSRGKRGGRQRFLVAFRLRALTDSMGSPSSLRRNPPASLLYTLSTSPSEPPILAPGHQEKREGIGRNPWAPEASSSQTKKIIVWGQTLWNLVKLGDVPFHVEFAMDRFSRRADRLLPLAWIIMHISENTQYLYGETYTPLLFKPLPRIFFPDKTKDMVEFGQRYGFLPQGNDVNAFKPHKIGELYVNFGPGGVLLGMFMLGILYRVIYAMFFHSGASITTLAAGTHILTVLLVNVETVTSATWGFVFWYFVFLLSLSVTARVGRWWMGRAKLTKRPTTASSTE